ncbi:MAG: hypothetical protein GTN81_04335 [Proteobacteria bacterium]|nr:hypothetical protein [Pseudomonadota bacterium]
MKKKNTLILFFMLVFTGAALLGYTPAWADAPVIPCGLREPPHNYSETEEEGICVNIRNVNEQTVYVVRAVDFNGDYLNPAPPVGLGPPYVGNGWPYQVGGTGPYYFTYEVGPSPDVVSRAVRVSALSYVITKLLALPSPGSDPPGAQLDVNNIDPSCIIPLSPGAIYFKWNASSNNKTSDTITILAPSPEIWDCGYVSVLFKTDCDGGPLFLPAIVEPTAFEPDRTFECEEWDVIVHYDRCTGAVLNVDCDDRSGADPAPAEETENPYFYAHVPDGATVAIPIVNMGPPEGVVACTGPDPPVFVVGNRAYWCGGAP